MIHFHIITLFPEAIEPYLASSILGRAREGKKIQVSFYDPKDFTRDRYGRVDRRPYGGGPGMVLKPEALLRAVEKALKRPIVDLPNLSLAYQAIDKAAKRGVIKKNTAARMKSRLVAAMRRSANSAKNPK